MQLSSFWISNEEDVSFFFRRLTTATNKTLQIRLDFRALMNLSMILIYTSSGVVLALKAWSAPNYCYRCGNVASILSFSENMVAKKNAQKSKTLLTDIEWWQKGVASTDVFGVPIEVTVQC